MTAFSPTPTYGDASALTRPAEGAALELVAQASTASPTVMVQNLGIAVRQLREKRGWSQEELAERSGLNRSYVGEIERGKVVASVVTAHKLAHALSVSIVDLFTQSDAIARMRSRLWKQ